MRLTPLLALALSGCVDLNRPAGLVTEQDAGQTTTKDGPVPDTREAGARADIPGALDRAPAPNVDMAPPPDVAPPVNLMVGIVAHWRLDDAVGSMMVMDSSGSGNHGMHMGGPMSSTITAPVMFPNPRSLEFPQGNPGVRVPDSPTLSLTGNFTIAAWVRPTTIGGTAFRGVVEKWETVDAGPQNGYFLRLDSIGTMRGTIFAGNTPFTVNGNRKVTPQTWTHVALVREGPRLSLYVDGAIDKEAAPGPVPTGNGTSPLEIGRAMGTSPFEGLIDDVRIYNRALTPMEMAALARGNQ